jgi:hypothetical protein
VPIAIEDLHGAALKRSRSSGPRHAVVIGRR